MKPRILLVNLEGAIGGAERSLLLMIKYLRNDCEIAVACPAEGSLWTALARERIDRHKLPASPQCTWLSLKGFRYWLRAGLRLLKIARKTRPDVVHANSLYAGMTVLPAAVLLRKRLILHARDLANLGLLARFCSLFCRKMIAVSNAVAKELVAQGVRPERITVIHNGTDETSPGPSRCPDLSTRPTRSNGDGPFVFANVGQFVPWKKQMVFLEAASRVAPKLPKARFILVGDDVRGRDCAYKQSIRQFVNSLAIAEKVSLVGWQEDMEEFWPKIDCLVHTATREPFGRVIIEAMAYRIPVIAAAACGPGEIIDDGKTGILVRGDDIDGFSEAMLRIATDQGLARRLGGAGGEHVVANFTAGRTAAQIRNVYEEILAM